MATNLSSVMDAIGAALGSVSGLRVHDFPPKSAQPPFAFPDMPDSIDYDESFGRGTDRMTLRVFVGVADVVDRAARDKLASYCAGSGAGSIKAAIEGASIGQSVRVTRVEFGPVQLAASTYAGAVFFVDVAA